MDARKLAPEKPAESDGNYPACNHFFIPRLRSLPPCRRRRISSLKSPDDPVHRLGGREPF